MKYWKLLFATVFLILLFGCGNEAGKSMLENRDDSPDSQIDETENDGSYTGAENNEEENFTEETPELLLPKEYFNVLKEVEGKQVIQNVDNLYILVNKEMFLPPDYVPDDLVRPDVRFVFGDEDVEKSYLRKEAAEALEKMFEAAEAEGIFLYASSGYRSYKRQEAIFQNKVSQVGEEAALEVVAYPGQSEHQTGLAMDITSESNQFQLTESFENTPEGKWLAENAHKFGFILRYPKGKEGITGYSYEPWHFRYVGVEYATIIYENQWTLEEFFEEASSI